MLARNRVVQGCAVAMALFVPALMLPGLYLFDLINALTVCLASSVVLAYWPGFKESARRLREPGGIEPGHFLVLGIMITWLFVVFRTVWIAVWRSMGEPDGGLDHWVFALAAWCLFPGAILHLLSPKLLLGSVPRAGWAALLNAVALAIVLFIAMASWRWAHS